MPITSTVLIQYMKNLFFKILLLSGIPFGLLISVFSLHREEITDIILNAILSGLIFGTLTSYILISLHRSLSKKVITDMPIDDYGIHQTRSIKLNLSCEQAYDLSLQALKAIKKCRIKSQSPDAGEIRARTGLTWKTWGDDIIIKLTKVKKTTLIDISSRPSAKSTLVDFGKNLDNVERIRKFLLDH